MLTKEETIAKVHDIEREACRYWEVLDGLADRAHIEREKKRIHETTHAVIEYIKNNS